ncbi:MAG: hypothetical protein BWK78_07965 [Thiotrichaceae bacterium IS1]|nr:MAG: hypothetical protein BWK78_07965 [Thiotrichaceae bacterium IS1]
MTTLYVLDSNMLIYYLNASLTESVRQQVEEAIGQRAFISTITRIEVLGWHQHSPTSFSGRVRPTHHFLSAKWWASKNLLATLPD